MVFPSFFGSSKKSPPTEKRTVLSDVTWQKFEALLAELGAERQTRLTYYRGKLELMTPIAAHERCNKLLESLIFVIAEELHSSVTNLNSVLLKAPQLGCAIEPDACYYLQAEQMQGRAELILPHDPLPDLLIEVALTKSNLDKLQLYTALQIPEVWRYITTADEDILKGKLLIYTLQGDRYTEANFSSVFPFLSANRVQQFLQESDSINLAAAIRLLRSWVKENT
ncbi:Uma2 family endonuclease [Phormidium tenue FACHB-886]|nr:Uma2 family endonuclease [Phormidium tenue FACHB-886]